MPIANLPWLNSGPQLFLEALKAGTESGLSRQRNELEQRGQDLQAAAASARNATEREQIARAFEMNQGRLAKENAELALRSQLGDERMGLLSDRVNLARDMATAKSDTEREKMAALERFRKGQLELGNRNADERAKFHIDQAKAKADALSNKPTRPIGPMIDVAGSKVHADDPALQSLLSTPQTSILTNKPPLLSRLFDAVTPDNFYKSSPETYTTNTSYPEPSDITTNQLLRAYSSRRQESPASATNRFKVILAE